MSAIEITEHCGQWLRGVGPDNDIVISSRVRLARNIAGHLFTNRANHRQNKEIFELCRNLISTKPIGNATVWIDLSRSQEIDRKLLVERHLISRQHAESASAPSRAVAFDRSEMFSIMINEEDHLRMQVLRSGMQLGDAFKQIDRLDDQLESGLEYAYSPDLGYLTACPTNVGTALRVSVMLHLPALKLIDEIEKIKRAAKDMHLAVRGLFGEGSQALGDLYQISNQTTLGKTEQEIVDDFQNNVVPQIIASERQARQALIAQRPNQLDDKIFRAWALLTNARIISCEESLALLSYLRLGINLNRINNVDIRTINDLLLLTQPAHLQKISGQQMETDDQKTARATLIRNRLACN